MTVKACALAFASFDFVRAVLTGVWGHKYNMADEEVLKFTLVHGKNTLIIDCFSERFMIKNAP